MVDFILDGAIRVLLAEGLDRFSTTNVAHAAGVSVGSLYQYFPNRDALLAAILARYIARLSEALGATPLDGAATFEMSVRAIMERLVTHKRASIRLALALQPEMPRIQGRAIIVTASRDLTNTVDRLLSRHRLERPANDVAWSAGAIGAVSGLLSEIVTSRPEALADDALPARLASVFLAAIDET